jgi:protease I
MQMTDIQPGTGGLSVRAIVVSADGFEDTELLIPYFRLLEEGALVRVAAPTREEIGGENGYSLLPDLTFDEVDPDAYDLLVIPGGFPDGAPATVRDDPRARAIARAFMAADKPVATICHGPWLLAAADVVRGRHLTSYWHDGVPEDVRAAGGVWEDLPVVVDRNLVSSRWPPDLPAFTAAMMRLVRERALR